jgi:aminoglycoside phosphotransferase (APT) family kinase protein
MTKPPVFTSVQEFISHRGDVGFWWPHISEILKRHGLLDGSRKLVAGFNPTYPTFLYGDVVVKLFGYSRAWRESYAAERAAMSLIATDPEIAAPELLADGKLYDDNDTPLPYLVSKRIAGVALRNANLTDEQRISVVMELGQQVRRIHALHPSGVAVQQEWTVESVIEAAKRSSLTPHLVAQIDEYLTRPVRLDNVFVHGDLVSMHAFVNNGRLTGIIDWGDATVTDCHYEIIQLYRDMFGCDKSLLKVFLEAGDWPVDRDFPRKAMRFALYRQTAGIAQHHSMDVFEPVAARFPLQDIATLDDLADELFAI